MKSNTRIVVLLGLPGSGKTHFVKSNKEEIDVVVDIDEYRTLDSKPSLDSYLTAALDDVIGGVVYKTVYIDGFICNSEYEGFIDFMKKYAYNNNDCSFIVDTVYFKPNKEKCLYNDTARREKVSTATIKSTNLVKPEKNENSLNLHFSVVVKEVQQMTIWQLEGNLFLKKLCEYKNTLSESFSPTRDKMVNLIVEYKMLINELATNKFSYNYSLIIELLKPFKFEINSDNKTQKPNWKNITQNTIRFYNLSIQTIILYDFWKMIVTEKLPENVIEYFNPLTHFADNNSITNTQIVNGEGINIISDSWDISGEVANCWGDRNKIYPTCQENILPKQLDLLGGVTTHLPAQYNNFGTIKSFLKVSEETIEDYYQTRVTSGFYYIDLNGLLHHFLKTNLIK